MTTVHRPLAECLAAPWLDPEAFHNASLQAACSDPWLIQRLQRCASAHQASLHFHSVWPGSCKSLLGEWRAHAKTLLRLDGTRFVLHAEQASPGEELLRWRAFTLRLPASLFQVAATPRRSRPAQRVSLLPRWLAPTERVAHLHVHLNASAEFELLWTHLMTCRVRLGKLTGAPAGFRTEDWRVWLAVAAAVRPVLAAGLLRPTTDPVSSVSAGTTDDTTLIRQRVHAVAVLLNGSLPNREATQNQRWAAALRHDLKRQVGRSARKPGTKADLWLADPIADGEPWPEGALLARWFTLLEGRTVHEDWRLLLVQYLRLKCQLYAWLVSDPLAEGLAAFVETFDRLRPYREGLDDLAAHGLLTDADLPTLGAVECRKEPKPTREMVRTSERLGGLAVDRGLEVGWVLHLIRNKGSNPARRFAAVLAGANQLRRTLRVRPALLQWIRGVDLAGAEKEGPLWLAARELARIRAEADAVSASSGVPTLGLTLHVGEDFDHLLSGLRAVHEPILWSLARPGDRLGHALALGWDAATWVHRHPHTTMRRLDRLWDLAWLLGVARGRFLRPQGQVVDTSAVRALEPQWSDQAKQLLQLLGVAGDFDLVGYYEQLGQRDLRAWLSRGFEPACALDALLHSWFRGEHGEAHPLATPITVDCAQELQTLESVQLRLGSEVSRWQLAVEVNPTSNLVIGGLGNVLAQPMFRLHPFHDSARHALPITLNADDPTTLATRLSDEFAYAWAGIVASGEVGPALARAWLNEAAAASWQWRFTLPYNVAQRTSDGVERPPWSATDDQPQAR